MSYWTDQPINITEKSNEIKPIVQECPPRKHKNLPEGFSFKTLDIKYLDDIHTFLSNHFIEDDQHIVRFLFAKDFIYWYLKYIPSEFIIGLVYKKKIVGFITSILLDMIVCGQKMKVPYVDLLCIQSKIRNLGFGPMLIDEIRSRIYNAGLRCALFTTMKTPTKSFCTSVDYTIPINYQKLKEVGFLEEDLDPIQKIDDNPLHLMVASDIDSVVPQLNKFLEKFDIKPYFTEDSAHHFLLPKKNIVYSFVKRDECRQVSDFVSVYKHYYYCIDKNKTISIGQLAFYYHNSLTLTELVQFLLAKLMSYGFCQLTFRNIMDNLTINLTKFATHGQLNYFFYNVDIKKIEPYKLSFYPF